MSILFLSQHHHPNPHIHYSTPIYRQISHTAQCTNCHTKGVLDSYQLLLDLLASAPSRCVAHHEPRRRASREHLLSFHSSQLPPWHKYNNPDEITYRNKYTSEPMLSTKDVTATPRPCRLLAHTCINRRDTAAQNVKSRTRLQWRLRMEMNAIAVMRYRQIATRWTIRNVTHHVTDLVRRTVRVDQYDDGSSEC